MWSPSSRPGPAGWFYAVRWGEKSFVALYLSLISGVVVALQYDAAAPSYSANTIELLIPFGGFWRSLHFYASQLFFLCFLCHFAVIVTAGIPAMPYRKWLLLVASLPVTVLLLFTGYVLRADATGEAAGAIAENIMLSVPVAGEWLNALLFSIARDGMVRVYANHVVGLGLLWLVLCWDHVRRYRVGFRQHGGFAVALLLFCLLIEAPLESYRPGIFYIAGPWFFLGLQELLRVFPPFWAGVFLPLLFLAALLLVPLGAVWRRRALGFVVLWLVVYGVLTVVGALRGVAF
ncbi:MAG: cytochrome b N-terminal domain-containing protein [Thermodesulfobacteriota bacterium]